VLQGVAIFCNALHHDFLSSGRSAVCCSALQCVAMRYVACCRVLQCAQSYIRRESIALQCAAV